MQDRASTNPGNRSKRTRTSRKRLSRTQVVLRLVLLALIAALLVVAGALLLRVGRQQGTPTSVQVDLGVSPALNPLEAAALGAYLTLNNAALTTPASSDTTPVRFTVESGQNAAQIADNLQALGLITNADLFRAYAHYYGLDVQIEAGTFDLNAAMTIPEIARALTNANAPDLIVRVTEGWRREQIADWIEMQGSLPFTGAEFLAATAPGATLPADVTFAADLPTGVSLEGFLFPDTYRIGPEEAASGLVEKMLRTFDARVTPQMRADAASRGLTLYQVVTLASIVEREAAVAEERPTIASVYLNRLATGMKLDADPTVQYAMGYQSATGEWWNLGLTQQDYYAVDSPYNTYLYPGLPPGPIASPGLASIEAVIYPADTPYLFFRAACDDSGRHDFAVTFEEHQANACP